MNQQHYRSHVYVPFVTSISAEKENTLIDFEIEERVKSKCICAGIKTYSCIYVFGEIEIREQHKR